MRPALPKTVLLDVAVADLSYDRTGYIITASSMKVDTVGGLVDEVHRRPYRGHQDDVSVGYCRVREPSVVEGIEELTERGLDGVRLHSLLRYADEDLELSSVVLGTNRLVPSLQKLAAHCGAELEPEPAGAGSRCLELRDDATLSAGSRGMDQVFEGNFGNT